MSTLLVKGGTCITPWKEIRNATILVQDGIIVSVNASRAEEIPPSSKVIDATGLYVCPGFVDIQVNGAAGFDVLDGTDDALKAIARFNARHGTTSFLPTLISSPIDQMTGVLELVRNLQTNNHVESRIIGVHLEGPYISRKQIGAHDPRYVRVPTLSDIDTMLHYADIVKIITAAPEVPGVLGLCKEMVEHGGVASIGHSNATFEEVLSAVKTGFTLVTHIYSVMSSMMRIGPRKVAGVLEASLLLDELNVGVVGDGLHVPEPFIKLVFKAKGASKAILVTDAIRATGLPDGKYAIGGKKDGHFIVVENGIAMTIDRKLYAGSTATMETCVRNAIKLGGISLTDAVAMATINPARLLKMEDEIGSLEPGRRGDIVILDSELNLVQTIIGGEVVFQLEGSTSFA